jgi:mono/diheme cytochrome c family protein
MRLYLVPGVLAVAGMVWAPTHDPKAAVAAEPKADKAPTYKADIAPLFKDACAGCHSGLKKKARLDVTDYDSLMKFVKAGEPDKSKLHGALLGKGAKLMPPKNPLSDDQVALVRAWIAGGAKKD